MTDYTYDDFDDAAECILGAAKGMRAAAHIRTHSLGRTPSPYLH